MRDEVPVNMISEVRIQFKFNEGDEKDLGQINQMLAAMDLTDVEVEELSVYICTTWKYENDVVVDTAYRCGLGEGVLVCRKTDAEDTYRYQIATEVFEAGAMKPGAFAIYWHRKYPRRKLKMVKVYDFDERIAVVVVYFEEIGE